MRLLSQFVKASLLSICTFSIVIQMHAQINKEHVDKAPKEEWAPMPHIDPDDSTVMKVKQGPSTNIWRDVLDYSQFPKRENGPMNIQRYELQMEPVGIKDAEKLCL